MINATLFRVKPTGLYYVFNANVSLATQRPVSDVINTVARSGAFGWHNIFI